MTKIIFVFKMFIIFVKLQRTGTRVEVEREKSKEEGKLPRWQKIVKLATLLQPEALLSFMGEKRRDDKPNTPWASERRRKGPEGSGSLLMHCASFLILL